MSNFYLCRSNKRGKTTSPQASKLHAVGADVFTWAWAGSPVLARMCTKWLWHFWVLGAVCVEMRSCLVFSSTAVCCKLGCTKGE